MDADIIRMAREAGLMTVRLSRALEQVRLGQLARFAELARADEREACAKRLEAIGCDHCAANIRARSQPAPCPDCLGIGYDASGQLCACQENPSF